MKNTKIILKSFLVVTLALVFICSLVACSSDYENGYTLEGSTETDAEVAPITFDALLYDNAGNNYAIFKGNSFNIEPNKVKQYGYSTDGHWTYWYEMSSVVSINIDGHNIQTCGSSVVFKDSRLEMKEIPEYIESETSTESGYDTNIGDNMFLDYMALTNWWFDTHENGQGGSKIVLIQSQDGYNIGAIEGNDIYWEVASKLPKTTLVNVDGKALYIHRCNFTIIDTALFNTVEKPSNE